MIRQNNFAGTPAFSRPQIRLPRPEIPVLPQAQPEHVAQALAQAQENALQQPQDRFVRQQPWGLSAEEQTSPQTSPRKIHLHILELPGKQGPVSLDTTRLKPDYLQTALDRALHKFKQPNMGTQLLKKAEGLQPLVAVIRAEMSETLAPKQQNPAPWLEVSFGEKGQATRLQSAASASPFASRQTPDQTQAQTAEQPPFAAAAPAVAAPEANASIPAVARLSASQAAGPAYTGPTLSAAPTQARSGSKDLRQLNPNENAELAKTLGISVNDLTQLKALLYTAGTLSGPAIRIAELLVDIHDAQKALSQLEQEIQQTQAALQSEKDPKRRADLEKQLAALQDKQLSAQLKIPRAILLIAVQVRQLEESNPGMAQKLGLSAVIRQQDKILDALAKKASQVTGKDSTGQAVKNILSRYLGKSIGQESVRDAGANAYQRMNDLISLLEILGKSSDWTAADARLAGRVLYEMILDHGADGLTLAKDLQHFLEQKNPGKAAQLEKDILIGALQSIRTAGSLSADGVRSLLTLAGQQSPDALASLLKSLSPAEMESFLKTSLQQGGEGLQTLLKALGPEQLEALYKLALSEGPDQLGSLLKAAGPDQLKTLYLLAAKEGEPALQRLAKAALEQGDETLAALLKATRSEGLEPLVKLLAAQGDQGVQALARSLSHLSALEIESVLKASAQLPGLSDKLLGAVDGLGDELALKVYKVHINGAPLSQALKTFLLDSLSTGKELARYTLRLVTESSNVGRAAHVVDLLKAMLDSKWAGKLMGPEGQKILQELGKLISLDDITQGQLKVLFESDAPTTATQKLEALAQIGKDLKKRWPEFQQNALAPLAEKLKQRVTGKAPAPEAGKMVPQPPEPAVKPPDKPKRRTPPSAPERPVHVEPPLPHKPTLNTELPLPTRVDDAPVLNEPPAYKESPPGKNPKPEAPAAHQKGSPALKEPPAGKNPVIEAPTASQKGIPAPKESPVGKNPPVEAPTAAQKAALPKEVPATKNPPKPTAPHANAVKAHQAQDALQKAESELLEKARQKGVSGENLARLKTMARELGKDGIEGLSRLLDKVGRGSLNLAIESFEYMLETARKVMPLADFKKAVFSDESLEVISKMLSGVSDVLKKLGVSAATKIGPKVGAGLLKAIPAIGALFSGYDTVKMGKIALTGSWGDKQYKDPNVRALALLGASVNGTDTALAVAEAFGIGNVGIAASIGMAVVSIGIDIAVDYYNQNPMSPEMAKKIRQGSALAAFGGAITAPISGGGSLPVTAALLKIYGAKTLATELKGLGAEGLKALRQLASMGEAAAKEAIQALKELALAGGELGLKALDELQGMGKTGAKAIADLILEGGQLARAALERLRKMGDQGRTALQDMITELWNQGQTGLQKLVELYNHSGLSELKDFVMAKLQSAWQTSSFDNGYAGIRSLITEMQATAQQAGGEAKAFVQEMVRAFDQEYAHDLLPDALYTP